MVIRSGLGRFIILLSLLLCYKEYTKYKSTKKKNEIGYKLKHTFSIDRPDLSPAAAPRRIISRTILILCCDEHTENIVFQSEN